MSSSVTVPPHKSTQICPTTLQSHHCLGAFEVQYPILISSRLMPSTTPKAFHISYAFLLRDVCTIWAARTTRARVGTVLKCLNMYRILHVLHDIQAVTRFNHAIVMKRRNTCNGPAEDTYHRLA